MISAVKLMSNLEQTSDEPRSHPSAIPKPARLARTEPTRSRAKARSSAKINAMESKRPAYTGRVTRSRAAPAAGQSALDPPSQPPMADSKPQQSQPTGDSSQKVVVGPGAPPRRAARGKKKIGSEVSDGNPRSPVKGANGPIRKRKGNAQKEQEDEEAAKEPSAGPAAKSDAAATGAPATGRIPPRANKSASGIRRPKASDFYGTPDTPATDGGGLDVAVPITQEHQEQIVSGPYTTRLKTPPFRWDHYGISDKPVHQTPDSKRKTMAGKSGQEGKDKSTRKGKLPVKPTRGISRQHVPSPWLRNSASASLEQDVSPPLTAEYKGLDGEEEADPHDREMDKDYIPVGPGPMPRVPKLLKGPRKRPAKRRPSPPVPGDAAETSVISDAEDTPFPTRSTPRKELVPAPLPPAARPSRPVAEANPDIWNIDPQSIAIRGRRAFPARPGSVYCEVCFRDEVARWVRFRDNIVKILHLLGGDSALQEMCDLWQEVKDAEKGVIHEEVVRQTENGSRRRLRSPPPPPERVPAAGVTSDEGDRPVGKQAQPEGGRISAKKFIIVSDHAPPTATPHFYEYPSDVVGLVLLRILTERPRSNLNEAQRKEVKDLLANSREEIGMDVKLFDNLTSYCKWVLVHGRTTQPKADISGQSDPHRWWWEFDDTLQLAYQGLPTAPQSPSFFAEALARKAGDAAIARPTAREAATARDGAPLQHGTERLAQLQKTLGMAMPDKLFLKSIGDRIAQAKSDIENSIQTTTIDNKSNNNNNNNNNKRPSPPENQDASHLPRRKRLKPNNHSSSSSGAARTAATPQPRNAPFPSQEVPLLVPARPTKRVESEKGKGKETKKSSNNKPLLHLPCQNCAESLAFHHYRRCRPYSATYDDDDDNDGEGGGGKPWIKPLMWTFHLDREAAARRVRSVDEFVAFVEAAESGGRRVRTRTVIFPFAFPFPFSNRGSGSSVGGSGSGSGIGPTTSSSTTSAVGDRSQSELRGRQGEGEVPGMMMMKVMVDITAGETRVVIVDMIKGVFDVLCGRIGQDTGPTGSGPGDGEGEEGRRSKRKVRFEPGPVVMRRVGPARPVGMWETWRSGRLEGYRLI